MAKIIDVSPTNIELVRPILTAMYAELGGDDNTSHAMSCLVWAMTNGFASPNKLYAVEDEVGKAVAVMWVSKSRSMFYPITPCVVPLLYVLPDSRRKGYGGMLRDQATAYAKVFSCDFVSFSFQKKVAPDESFLKGAAISYEDCTLTLKI